MAASQNLRVAQWVPTGAVQNGMGVLVTDATQTPPTTALSQLPVGGAANPTATVALAVKNGVAATYMRSDAAPALDQGIVPTWTRQHIFASSGQTGHQDWAIKINCNLPVLGLIEADAGADGKVWAEHINAGVLNFSVFDDAITAPKNFLAVQRSQNAVGSLTFGNAIDNPTYNFVGTGAATFGGKISAADYQFPNNVTMLSAEGAGRLHFAAASTTYIMSPASVTFRPAGTSSDAIVFGAHGAGAGHFTAGVHATGWTTSYPPGLTCTMGVTGGNALVHAYNQTSGTYGRLNLVGSQVNVERGVVLLRGNDALTDLGDGWLRLNQSEHYTAGVYTPRLFRASNVTADVSVLAGTSVDNATQTLRLIWNAGSLAYCTAYITGTVGGYHGLAVYDGGLTPMFMSNNSVAGIYMSGEAGGPKWLLLRESTTVASCYYQLNAQAFNATSSRSIKRETGAPTNVRDILRRLRVVMYRLLADESREQIGAIAEEVHEICPQLSDGKTISYDRLAWLLLADWQERDAREVA